MLSTIGKIFKVTSDLECLRFWMPNFGAEHPFSENQVALKHPSSGTQKVKHSPQLLIIKKNILAIVFSSPSVPHHWLPPTLIMELHVNNGI